MPHFWNAHSDFDWQDECGMYDEPPERDEQEEAEIAQEQAEERAYRNGWSSCMQWLPREPPAGLDAECTELWLEGYDSAMDAPLGSGPGEADLMRVGVM